MKIISITTNLARYGGAQKVLMDVHNGLKSKFTCFVAGRQEFSELHPKYEIKKDEYVKFKLSILKNNIVLVHARNVVPFVVFLNKLFFLNARIIYISHNVYSTHKSLTVFPKTIVSISKKVTENLIHYFGRKEKNISLIYNGIKDAFRDNDIQRPYKENGEIKILYPARVNAVKRQLAIVEQLDGKLDLNIKIYFAGVGEDVDALKKRCANSPNFVVLGFVEDMQSLIANSDYLMLYSVQEGLPIALLEGVMNKKPLLVNDVGGNLEIGVPNVNGIELREGFQDLSKQLNELNKLSEENYYNMAENSRKLFLEKFRYDTMIEKYVELIERTK